MTTIMTKDRDYYRTQTTNELIEEAKRGVNVNWLELATVLTERLYDSEWEHRGEPTYCPRCDNEIG